MEAALALALTLALSLAGPRLAAAALADLMPSFADSGYEKLIDVGVKLCEILPLNILFSRNFESEMDETEILEATRGSKRTYLVTEAHRKIQELPEFPPKAVLIYIPGWLNSPNDDSSRALRKAFLKKYPVIYVLDTRQAFYRGYVGSASRVKALSLLLFEMIKNLDKVGISVESVHLVGFSLGAHVAGMTGRLLRERTNRSLERITALEPAKPCFVNATEYQITKKDAKFVHVFHTSMISLENPVGHLDVYINGVFISQPECKYMNLLKLMCDHGRAWQVFGSSANRALSGQRCGSWAELENKNCSSGATDVGANVDPNTRGIFLYKTKVVRKRDKNVKVFNLFDIISRML